MARIEARGLRRSVGVAGLFATAYGNVGSSIYYALGIVALHALGLTPVVFMIAGGLFALTAKTYAEGAAMFPEAGGSSSFARHAFNEVVSFIAGWALCLDYILTIAISAFFVPHYLGAFFPALKHGPGDVIGGIVVITLLAGLNIRGLGESAKLNFFLAIMELQVPAQLPLEAGLEAEEDLGLSVLEAAKVRGRKAGLRVNARLVRTRHPGATIVEEARRTHAEIIYLGTVHAPPSERALGPTASYLLAHRPCRVVIETGGNGVQPS